MVKKLQAISEKAKQLLKYAVAITIIIEIFEFAIAKLDKFIETKPYTTNQNNQS